MIISYVMYGLAALLTVLPSLIVWASKGYVIERRKLLLEQDFQAANTDSSPAFQYFVTSRGGVKGLQDQIERYMSDGLTLPLCVLLSLNAAGFAVATESVRGASSLGVPYTQIAYVFIGAYLFNFGVIVRRLSFADLNVHMVWGSVYRVILATGLCLAARGIPGFSDHPEVFFAVGFLSNVFLEFVLSTAQALLNITTSKRDDSMSLQMIRGVDFWKASRLEEEGIENIQNLATADVMELAVRTHYNLPTLVDWIDQALVIVRFRKDTCNLEKAGLNVSAIDLAWSSPRHSKSDDVADQIARTINQERAFVIAQMNSLFEDQYVKNLWILWQTRPGYQAPWLDDGTVGEAPGVDPRSPIDRQTLAGV